MKNEALLKFFKEKLPSIEEDYHWKGSGYLGTVDDMAGLAAEWRKSCNENSEEGCINVAYKVLEWGGIFTNNPGTVGYYVSAIMYGELNCGVEEYFNRVLSGKEVWELEGVSSYSKILRIADTSKYAIYDARVAAALNAAQLIYGGDGHNCLKFHLLKHRTRNETIKKFNSLFNERNFPVIRNWLHISSDENYSKYLKTLRCCLDEINS